MTARKTLVLLSALACASGRPGAATARTLVVGAIGIAGAPGGDEVAACAQVGSDKIAKGLGG